MKICSRCKKADNIFRTKIIGRIKVKISDSIQKYINSGNWISGV